MEIYQKPITLLREDFIMAMLDLCNNANLPYFVIEGVLLDILQEIRRASAKQLADDRSKYEMHTNKNVN